MTCPVCDGEMVEAFTRTILRKHIGQYDYCGNCGFLRVRAPHWLKEAYSAAISAADTGLVQRNLALADRLAALLPRLSDATGPFLDYGGGTGLLVRLMRDLGFDFRWHDAFAKNVLARGFEYGPDDPACITVTAFEVLEHVEHPVAFIREAMAAGKARTFIFTTELYSGQPPEDWWYYTPEEGQHIAFFRHDTLAQIARRLGLRLLSNGSFHMLTEMPISERVFASSGSRLARLLGRRRGRSRALTWSDHAAIVAGLSRKGDG